MANDLAQKIEAVLGPLVGTVLASVSVDLESKRIGRTPDTLTYADLPELSANLSTQLRILVGQEMADAAARRVRSLA